MVIKREMNYVVINIVLYRKYLIVQLDILAIYIPYSERNGSAHDISVLIASVGSECSNEYASTRSLVKPSPSHMHMYVEVENDSNQTLYH